MSDNTLPQKSLNDGIIQHGFCLCWYAYTDIRRASLERTCQTSVDAILTESHTSVANVFFAKNSTQKAKCPSIMRRILHHNAL